MDEEIPKKRGRKPKIVDLNIVVDKKKRGRKPTGKIIDLNSNTLDSVSNCIIAHLPLNNKDITKITGSSLKILENENKINENKIVSSINININDDICDSYRCERCTLLEKQCLDLKNKLNEVNLNKNIERKQYICKLNIVDISNNNLIWKEKTDISCWWCCNKFETVPIGLPEKYINSNFYVHGCFCSFNCAHSYNINLNDSKIWDRYSLLNFMKIKIDNTNDIEVIIPAPPRQALEMFGGPMNIEEFRMSSLYLTKQYIHLLPPMIPIYGILDELPRNQNNKNNFKLKRSKPLLSQNNNLLQMMQSDL